MDNRVWFKQAQFGMMAHWGLYSLLGGEWRGRRVNDYAEWIQAFMPISNSEYSNLPIYLTQYILMPMNG